MKSRPNPLHFKQINNFLCLETAAQNDNSRYCKDPAELAVIQEEDSPIGPLLRAVNQVARSLADEFPLVAVDTLAYSYTQLPPTVTRPERNVIIRLYVFPLLGYCSACRLLLVALLDYSSRDYEWYTFCNLTLALPQMRHLVQYGRPIDRSVQ